MRFFGVREISPPLSRRIIWLTLADDGIMKQEALNVHRQSAITITEVHRNNTWILFPLHCRLSDFHENDFTFRII